MPKNKKYNIGIAQVELGGASSDKLTQVHQQAIRDVNKLVGQGMSGKQAAGKVIQGLSNKGVTVGNINFLDTGLGGTQPKGDTLDLGGDTDIGSVVKFMKKEGYLPETGQMATSVDTQGLLQEQLAAAKKAIRARFEPRIETAEERAERETGVARAQAYRWGAGAAGTAEMGYISSVREQGEDRINKLKKARDEALASADMEYANSLLESIQREQERVDELRQQEFQNIMNIWQGIQTQQRIGISRQQEQRQWEKLDLDWQEFQAGEVRAQRNLAIREAETARRISEDEREKAIENIKSMAQSFIPVESISEELRTQYEVQLGLPTGTFEAYYDKLVRNAQRGETIENLEMERLKAQIARTYQLARGGIGGGAEVTGEEGEPYPDMRAIATKYLQTSKDEQDRFIPTGPYDQPKFWAEVEWLQSQGTSITGETITEGQNQELIQKFTEDIQAGMPLEDAFDLYPELGPKLIKNAYSPEQVQRFIQQPREMPGWYKATSWIPGIK